MNKPLIYTLIAVAVFFAKSVVWAAAPTAHLKCDNSRNTDAMSIVVVSDPYPSVIERFVIKDGRTERYSFRVSSERSNLTATISPLGVSKYSAEPCTVKVFPEGTATVLLSLIIYKDGDGSYHCDFSSGVNGSR